MSFRIMLVQTFDIATNLRCLGLSLSLQSRSIQLLDIALLAVLPIH